MFSHSGSDMTFHWSPNNKLIDPKQIRSLSSAFSPNLNQSPVLMKHRSFHICRRCISFYTETHEHTRRMPRRNQCQPHVSASENYPLTNALAVFEERTPRQTKVLHYFRSWWDPPMTFHNCFTEKAFGRINNYQLLQRECQLFKCMFTAHHAPSRHQVQIISFRANDAGTNEQQRLLAT